MRVPQAAQQRLEDVQLELEGVVGRGVHAAQQRRHVFFTAATYYQLSYYTCS